MITVTATTDWRFLFGGNSPSWIRDYLRDRRLLSLYDVSIDDGERRVPVARVHLLPGPADGLCFRVPA
jgi:hypothetical protein